MVEDRNNEYPDGEISGGGRSRCGGIVGTAGCEEEKGAGWVVGNHWLPVGGAGCSDGGAGCRGGLGGGAVAGAGYSGGRPLRTTLASTN